MVHLLHHFLFLVTLFVEFQLYSPKHFLVEPQKKEAWNCTTTARLYPFAVAKQIELYKIHTFRWIEFHKRTIIENAKSLP